VGCLLRSWLVRYLGEPPLVGLTFCLLLLGLLLRVFSRKSAACHVRDVARVALRLDLFWRASRDRGGAIVSGRTPPFSVCESLTGRLLRNLYMCPIVLICFTELRIRSSPIPAPSGRHFSLHHRFAPISLSGLASPDFSPILINRR